MRYVLEYADFLASLTEDHNTRALFEKARPRPPRALCVRTRTPHTHAD